MVLVLNIVSLIQHTPDQSFGEQRNRGIHRSESLPQFRIDHIDEQEARSERDDGGIDAQIFEVRIIGQRLEDPPRSSLSVSR
jgi:hypothetical protein